MSGGYFDYQFPIYQAREICGEIDKAKDDCWHASEETKNLMGVVQTQVMLSAQMLHSLDYFLEGDHGEDTFQKDMEELML